MKLKRPLFTYIPVLLFIMAILTTIIVSYYITGSCIDSDASSELVLSNHLAETGQILSKDWIYSTELRVINTQLVYAPLFLIFSSWHLVRYVGSLILQGGLIFCLYILFRLLRLSKNAFYVSAALLLLPVSVCYGRIVLYNCYYIPHICLSLLIVALTFRAKRSGGHRIWPYIEWVSLFILSFLGGLGGIRQLMMTHAPILLCVLILSCLADSVSPNANCLRTRTYGILWIKSILSVICFFGGFIFNKYYLMRQYIFADYSENTVKLLNSEKWTETLYGLLHHFGFRDDLSLLTILGVLAALSIPLFIYFLIVCIRKLSLLKDSVRVEKLIIFLFPLSYLCTMLFIFLILGDGFYNVLYFTPLVAWFIPALTVYFFTLPRSMPLFNVRRLLALVAVLVVAVNGAVNTVYFLDDTLFPQKYEGLVYQNKNRKAQMHDVVAYLTNEGYTLGYATFWNGNILTEITDGQIKCITVELNEENGSFKYYDWLTLISDRQLTGQKAFLLLELGEQSGSFETYNDPATYQQIYSDAHFVAYQVNN